MTRRKPLPPVFGTADLARVLGWSVRRVRRFCERHGMGAESHERCKHLTLTYAVLIEKAPDVYYALVAAGAIGAHQETAESH